MEFERENRRRPSTPIVLRFQSLAMFNSMNQSLVAQQMVMNMSNSITDIFEFDYDGDTGSSAEDSHAKNGEVF